MKNLFKNFSLKIPSLQNIAWAIKNPGLFFQKYRSVYSWKKYFNMYNFRALSVQKRFLLDEKQFQSLCTSLIPYLKPTFPKINKHSFKKSLLVETRILPHTEFVIKNTIQKLGDGWGHMIFCSKQNYKQIQSICKDISPDIEIIVLKKEIKTKNDYNNLMLSLEFWDQIICEKVLVYQTDTFIFKDFDDDFLQWDYIGAPVENAISFTKEFSQIQVLLNGGLSLRSVIAVKNILSIYAPFKNIISYESDIIPEDMFFCYHFDKENYILPTKKEALLFSYEYPIGMEGFHDSIGGSFGSHCPEKSITLVDLSHRLLQSFSFSSLLHIYVITWNNATNLEYFITYYRNRFPDCAITVYDNASTDDTHAVASTHNCRYVRFETDGLDDTMNQHIKNTCWKNQKETWAFCLDDDELLDLHIVDLLQDSADVIPFVGIERFHRKKHMKNTIYNKPVAFRVKNMKETNFTLGAHAMNPEGYSPIRFSSKVYFLVHDKYINEDALHRNALLKKRTLSQFEEKQWSWHYHTDILGYYRHGVDHGVPYEDIHNAPEIRYEGFRIR